MNTVTWSQIFLFFLFLFTISVFSLWFFFLSSSFLLTSSTSSTTITTTMKMAATKSKFNQKNGCEHIVKSFWTDPRSIPSSLMALTLDVGGGSGLVAMNRGLRTCSDGGLSWALWVKPWDAVNLVLAGFVTFGWFWLLGYDVWWWLAVVWLVGLWWWFFKNYICGCFWWVWYWIFFWDMNF